MRRIMQTFARTALTRRIPKGRSVFARIGGSKSQPVQVRNVYMYIT